MATKLCYVSLLFAFMALVSCKNGQSKDTPAPQAGMFKVSILYQNGEDKTFDMDYYEKKHMPMVAGFLGKNLQFYGIDQGIAGRTPNDKAPFVTIGYFYINNVADYNKAIAQNIDAIVNDFKNYTNIQPIVQISEIKQVVYHNTESH